MNTKIGVNDKDQILMQLAHYFITVENYTPMLVRGVHNEIWLENIEAPYKIIRINTNYIHNNEQLDYDLMKIRNIVRQVRKKTLSFSVKTLNILLDVGNTVKIKNDDKIDVISINKENGIKKSKEINELYPELKNNLLETKDGIEFLINVTHDINMKSEKQNREFENVFKKKKLSLVYILIALNVLIFFINKISNMTGSFNLYNYIVLEKNLVKAGQIYRIITCAFAHYDIFHLLMNMYSLFIIGSQIETFIGKKKFIGIYLFSAITGSLLSCIASTSTYDYLVVSMGASGAIFGLMGALVYFGYHYRLYLDSVLKKQLIPLIMFNLILGFAIPTIDNSAHIGGLVGGLFMAMAVGIENKSTKSDRTNGIVCSSILFIFMVYLLFFAK